MIRVHTGKQVHEFPSAGRFSTEEDYNNLCVWSGDALVAVFADGAWIMVELCDA